MAAIFVALQIKYPQLCSKTHSACARSTNLALPLWAQCSHFLHHEQRSSLRTKRQNPRFRNGLEKDGKRTFEAFSKQDLADIPMDCIVTPQIATFSSHRSNLEHRDLSNPLLLFAVRVGSKENLTYWNRWKLKTTKITDYL